MPTLADIRKKYPQYNDLSDKELAEGFHRKFYSDLPFDEFATKVGYEEPGVLGTLAEIPKGLGAGAAGLLESAAIGASAILPEEQERAARAKIQELAAPVREALAPAQGYEEGVVRKGAEALGSTLPFFVLRPLGIAGRVAGAGLGMGAGAGEARTRAELGGATEGAGAAATGLGAIIGLSEMYAPGVSQAITGTIKRALVTGGLEGAQEAASQAAQNLVAKGLYDPNQPILIGTGEAGAYGAGVGALSQALVDFALGRRTRGAVTGAPEEKSQEPTQLPLPGIPAAETAAPPAGQLELPMEMPEAARPEVSEAQMDLFGGRTTTVPASEPIQEEMQFDQFPIPEPIKPVTPVEPIAEPTVRPKQGKAPVATLTPEELPADIPADIPGLKAFARALGFGRNLPPTLNAAKGKNVADPDVQQVLANLATNTRTVGASEKIAAYLNKHAPKETPSAVPDISVAETQQAPAGAGVSVPVSEQESEAGSPEEVGGQGLADTGIRAAEPVGREGVVAGALSQEEQQAVDRAQARVIPQTEQVVSPPAPQAAPAPVAPQGVQAVEALRRRLNKSASDAFENDLINESQYNAARDELKRSGFSEERVRKILSGEIKPRRTRTQLAPAGAGIPKVEAQKVVADLTQGWTNSPTINVVESVEELPESVRASAMPESRGLYDPETRTVHILAQNAESPESVKGTVFHESLGHFGLAEQFDTELDGVMSGIYQTNTAARSAADTWLKGNPTAYNDLAPQVRKARAVEEVLAARSEAGPIKEPGLRAAYNRVANFIRNVGRKFGLVKTYSDNDVNQILRQAHGRVYAAPRKVSKVKGVRLQTAAGPVPQAQFYAKALDSVMDTVDKLPEPTKQVVDRTLSALSAAGAGFKKGWIALQSFYHLEDAYGKWLPIGPLVRYIEKRASETSKILAADEKTLFNYKQAVNKHPKLEQAWRALFGDVTLYQIGPWEADSKKLVADIQSGARTQASLTPYEKKQYEVTKRFLALPKELQDTMQSIYADYEKRGEAAKQAAFRFLPPSVKEAFEKRFEATRLKYWAPLRRRGNYILTYLDKDGNYWSQRFESEYLRKRAIRDAQKLGATQINTSMNVREARTKGQLPAGFTADVLKAVEDSFPPNASADYKQQVLDNIYETYMDYVPSESLKQSTRGRTKFDVDGVTQIGVLGFDPDVLGTYEKYMAQSAYQMKNLEYAPLVDKAMTTLRDKVTELSSAPPQGVSSTDFADVLESIEGRVKFAANPTYADIVMLASKTNYVFSIAANVSTAIFNTTVLPTMAYSEMMAVHGPVKTYKAMQTAMGKFVRSGRDATGNYTYANKATGEHAELFKALEERGVLGIAAEQELRQAQSIKVKGYEGLSDKIGYYTSFMFRTTERFNREVVALSAFQLVRDKGGSVEEAIQYAVDVNNRVNGPTLPELQSRLYQSNIGRIMLTFKTFVVNHMIHISRVFHAALKGESPEVRAQARKKLLGVYATTYMFAGIKGLPFFGAAEILANLLMGDDDEPYDAQQELLESVKTLGTDGPVAEMLNIATASRTGYADVLWRDDPKRLAEVGLPTFVLEKSLGPTWGLLLNYKRGFDEIGNGNLDRAMEAFTPAAARNVLKSLRYATEGVLDKNGNPIADDVSAYNTFMQAFGFAPQDLSIIQAQRGAKYEIDKKLRERRTALLTQRHAAKIAGDWEALAEINEAMIKFSRANPSIRIDNDTLKRSDAQHKRQRELMESGTYLPKKRAIAASKYVTLTEEELEELED